MNFSLKRPCPDCPFVPGAFQGLRSKRRREIGEAVLHDDKTFTCHKTISGGTDDETGEYIIGPKDQHCAGLLIVLKKSNKIWDNAMIRLAAMFTLFNPDDLDMNAETYNSVEEFMEDEGE